MYFKILVIPTSSDDFVDIIWNGKTKNSWVTNRSTITLWNQRTRNLQDSSLASKSQNGFQALGIIQPTFLFTDVSPSNNDGR